MIHSEFIFVTVWDSSSACRHPVAPASFDERSSLLHWLIFVIFTSNHMTIHAQKILFLGFIDVCWHQFHTVSITIPLQKVGLPGSSTGKESACNAGDPSLIPGLGTSVGEGIGYPLWYSWASLVAQMVKNPPAVWETGLIPVGPGEFHGLFHGVTKSWTQLSPFTFFSVSLKVRGCKYFKFACPFQACLGHSCPCILIWILGLACQLLWKTTKKAAGIEMCCIDSAVWIRKKYLSSIVFPSVHRVCLSIDEFFNFSQKCFVGIFLVLFCLLACEAYLFWTFLINGLIL